MATVFIAEKPSLARTVAGAIGLVKDHRLWLECRDDCVVIPAEGHVYEMLMPPEYDMKYKTWRLGDLPLDIPVLKYKPTERVLPRINTMRKFLGEARLVVHVGDPDREGQLIVDNILRELGYRGKVVRLWNFDQSPRGMEKTMAQFKSGFPDNTEARFVNLGEAALARTEIDWRLGMNISRALGCMLNAAGRRHAVSYGRFQSTVLNLIVQRERERRNFVPKTFYNPVALIDGVRMAYVHDATKDGYDTEGYLVDQGVARAVCDSACGKAGEVTEYTVKKGKKAPPLPYDLTKLIQDANKKHGISAAETNTIAQSLYDKGVTTYPRVQCRYLPEDHFQDASRILSALSGIPGQDKADAARKGACFNTKKTDEAAHHAIVPTGEAWTSLSGNELKVFHLVAQAYVLQFLPDMEFETQSVKVRLEDGSEWKVSGRKILSAGWTNVFKDDDEEDEPDLPVFSKGQHVQCDNAMVETGETRKPAAFTEASIIAAMENVDKFEPNPEYRKLLREAKGIGTGATRGGILQLLMDRGYIVITKSVIAPTPFGEELTDWIPEILRSPALTAIMEGDLDAVAQGRKTRQEVLQELHKNLPGYIEEVKKIDIVGNGSKCPACQGLAVRLQSKKGNWFWKCQECNNFYNDNEGKLMEPTPCPSCDGFVSRIPSRKKPGAFFWACDSCKKLFSDNNGTCGKGFDDGEKTACPTCEGEAMRRQSQKGIWYWRCSKCGNFRDENGKIGKNFDDYSGMQTAACPECGKTAIRRTSAKGTQYWTCTANRDHGPFSDDNDAPGKAFGSGGRQEQCPHCKGRAVQRESRKKAGQLYWVCDKCGFMSDEDGKPGKIFGGR